MKLFIPFDVWKRLPGKIFVRYRCFRVLPTDQYCVQSADFFYDTIDPQKIVESDQQFYELLEEQAPDERSELADSIEAAIAQHDQDFGWAIEADASSRASEKAPTPARSGESDIEIKE